MMHSCQQCLLNLLCLAGLLGCGAYACKPQIESTKRPHIVLIVAGDMGWNDVSFHGADQIPTPNIDALAYNGVILNRHYVLPICTPSRTSLMTDCYAIINGMQGMQLINTPIARGTCLFDIVNDPCETRDLTQQRVKVVKALESFIKDYRRVLMPQKIPEVPVDLCSFPQYFNGTWMP